MVLILCWFWPLVISPLVILDSGVLEMVISPLVILDSGVLEIDLKSTVAPVSTQECTVSGIIMDIGGTRQIFIRGQESLRSLAVLLHNFWPTKHEIWHCQFWTSMC